MSEPETVENFFGVYLLYNINPKYKGRTYIGYTRDPNRRIMQHNRGTWAGGAYRTSNRGPWKMTLIVHGFPNNISALRFEWAWQNPTKTIRLQHLNLKKIPRKESEFQFKLRVMTEMLQVGPWCRLPLVIRWLEEEYFEEFLLERTPPTHMSIVHGNVKVRNFKTIPDFITNKELCTLCSVNIKYSNSTLKCLNKDCVLVTHITCLADLFLVPGEYIPIEGYCPICNKKLKWGDLIRQMRGCNKGNEINDADGQLNENYEGFNEFENDVTEFDDKDRELDKKHDKVEKYDDVIKNNAKEKQLDRDYEEVNKTEETEELQPENKKNNELPYWFDDCSYDL